jgi:hypothetical protein
MMLIIVILPICRPQTDERRDERGLRGRGDHGGRRHPS